MQLVYGRQPQTQADETPAGELDVSSMTIEQRNRLKRRLLASNPRLVEELSDDEGGA